MNNYNRFPRFIAGTTLVEVMVALAITAMGIGGVVATQTMGLKSNQSSYYRSQADILLRDMADRIRANVAESGNYIVAYGDSPNCGGGAGCLSEQDISNWLDELDQQLPNGEGAIRQLDAAQGVIEVEVRWQDKVATGGASYCTEEAAPVGKDEELQQMYYCMALVIDV